MGVLCWWVLNLVNPLFRILNLPTNMEAHRQLEKDHVPVGKGLRAQTRVSWEGSHQ